MRHKQIRDLRLVLDAYEHVAKILLEFDRGHVEGVSFHLKLRDEKSVSYPGPGFYGPNSFSPEVSVHDWFRAEQERLATRLASFGVSMEEESGTPELQDLGLPSRIVSALYGLAHTTEELLQCSEVDLLKRRGIGHRSLRQIKKALAESGLSLREVPTR